MIKVAVVGAGFMGQMHASCYWKLPDTEIAYIVDTEQAKADALTKKYGGKAITQIDNVLSDPGVTIVDICLPTYLHPEYVISACKAKKDVLCEKPIALSLKDADQMVATAKENGVNKLGFPEPDEALIEIEEIKAAYDKVIKDYQETGE